MRENGKKEKGREEKKKILIEWIRYFSFLFLQNNFSVAKLFDCLTALYVVG